MSFKLGSKRYKGPLVSSEPTKFSRPFGRGNLNPGPSILGFYGRHGYTPESKSPSLGKRKSFVDTFAQPVAKKLNARGGKATTEYNSHFDTVTGMPKRFTRRRVVRTAKRRRFGSGSKSPRRFGSRSARPFRSFRGGIRRRFKRRYTKGSSRKSFARKVMMSVAADNVYFQDYSDVVELKQTDSSDAIQSMWAMNQSNSGVLLSTTGAVAPGIIANLGIWDPIMIYSIFNAFFPSTDPPTLTKQLYFSKWSTTARITNIETNPIELIEYRCRVRRGLPNGTADAPYKKLDALLRHSGDADSMTTAVLPTTKLYFSRYGCTAFDLPRWCREIKILKTKNWNMAPGQSIEIGYKAAKGRMMTLGDAYMQTLTAGDTPLLLDAMKGETFSLFVMRGTFVGKASLADGLRYGLGGARVGIIYKTKIHFRNLHPESRHTGIYQSLPGISGGATAAPTVNVVTITGGTTEGPTDQPQID